MLSKRNESTEVDRRTWLHVPSGTYYLDHMHPVELEIKDTTESSASDSYLDLLLSIEGDDQLHTATITLSHQKLSVPEK